MTDTHAQDSILQHRPYLVFWSSRLLSTLAYQMQVVAVGWQMYGLTGSTFDLGLIGLVQFLPSIALLLVVGQVADRCDRRAIIGVARAVVALAMAVLTLGSAFGWFDREWLLGFALVLGSARAFEFPTGQALVPNLVPTRLLSRAIAWSTSGVQAATIVGPALGGWLYLAGAPLVYGLCAGLFFISALVMPLVAIHADTTAVRSRGKVSVEHLLAGIRFIFRTPLLLGAVSLDMFVVLLGGATALLPVYASEILHTDADGLGLLRSAPAVGALLTALWFARHPIERHVGQRLFASVTVFGLATLVFGVSADLWLSLAALFVLGAADMVNVVIRMTIVQLETPDAMRGRVSSVNSVFIGASNQLGEFESGVTAHWWGTVPAVVIGGIGTLGVALLWRRLFPALRERDHMHAPAPSEPLYTAALQSPLRAAHDPVCQRETPKQP